MIASTAFRNASGLRRLLPWPRQTRRTVGPVRLQQSEYLTARAAKDPDRMWPQFLTEGGARFSVDQIRGYAIDAMTLTDGPKPVEQLGGRADLVVVLAAREPGQLMQVFGEPRRPF